MDRIVGRPGIDVTDVVLSAGPSDVYIIMYDVSLCTCYAMQTVKSTYST